MRLRHLFFFLAFVAIAILIIVQLGQLQSLIDVIKRVNLWLLAIVVVLRFFYYWTNTKYLQTYLANFNHKPAFKDLLKDIVVVNFADTIFPTGGVSGIAVLRGRLRKHNVSAHTSTVAQAFYKGFTGISFVALLMISLIFLFFSRRIELVSFRLILIVLVFMLVVGVILLTLILNREPFTKLLYVLTRPFNWILRRFKRNSLSRQQLNDLIDRFYETIKDYRKDWRKLIKPFMWCFLSLLIDIASLYMVFVAFGTYPNPGVIIAAFIVAMTLSVSSIFTSGVGVFEIGMVGVLVGLGMGFDLSFSASVLYRFIALWLFLPVGLYFYKKAMIDE